MGKFGITAHRSAASAFGRGVAPLLHNGQVQTFPTYEEAAAEAARLNAALRSANVQYVADRKPVDA